MKLFFMNPVSYGGHVSFTVHLMIALRAVGVEASLHKFGNKTETFERKFGYGEVYTNVGEEDVKKLCRSEIVLITAPSKPKAKQIQKMLDWGARIVIHDPAEFKHGWDWQNVDRPIVIRKSMLQYFDNAVFIKHPYDRLYKDEEPTHKVTAISTSRIDFDKHTEILLDANRLLPKKRKIHIRGFENRIYTRFNILPKYPEWVQSVAAYPRELRAAAKMLHEATFMCDMSIIKGDGGGTQYTFLEAMDAGAVCILNREWLLPKHVMKEDYNCLAVEDGLELSGMIKQYYKTQHIDLDAMRTNARKIFTQHAPKRIGRQYIKEFGL